MTKPVVYIVLYSLYQHVYKLSQSIQQGLEEKGVEVKVFQVAETLSDEILSKMQAPTKPDLPIMTVDKLAEPDGIIFGLPTRFGLFPAQIKTLLDASGALWAKGALAGKFAGTFFSTASQHGGQETTALTAVTYFAHHGMMYVPFGYANVALQNNDEVIGGSAYGSGTISDGDGSRQPTQTELDIAKNQGQNFGRGAIEGTTPEINNKLADGNVNESVASAKPATTASSNNATGTGAAAGAAGAAGASSSLGNAAPANATGGVPKDTAGNASTAPADTTLDANNGPATPVHGTANEGNAAPTNAITGTPSAPAGNAATTTTTTTTTNGASAAPTGGKNPIASTEPTTATPGNAADTTATNNASKVGASAGATAAGAASTVPNTLKDNKPKKKKKWFCC
ncbi:hypothetical protein MBANPS3_005326 [Mucor bainieri]